MRIVRCFSAATLSLFLIACASEVYRLPIEFTRASTENEPLMVVTRPVEVTPSTGYSRVLKAGSRWKYVGRVPQGKVYAIQDDVFLLEGKHMHEAQCVVGTNSSLVGFYLPVEQAFAPLSSPVGLPVKYQ